MVNLVDHYFLEEQASYLPCGRTSEDGRVRASPTWNLEPSTLKLFPWTNDFNPNLQKVTPAQVWIHLFRLTQKYWRPDILLKIANSVGTPIFPDTLASKLRFNHPYGYFTKVLMDMKFSVMLHHNVLVRGY
ncbi:unnamed protein product [Vicia faba]|uniref:DUF4283 domain-containing protein n=1 Tax=Vicia faba TaxID=3906 RepID=A0AAV0ZDQ7_VICFA|nr:unnamed protein product [Vicia faba]